MAKKRPASRPARDRHRNEVSRRFGAAVDRLRGATTPTELAKRAEMAHSAVWLLLHGRRCPDLITIERLAKGLGVPASVLVAAFESQD